METTMKAEKQGLRTADLALTAVFVVLMAVGAWITVPLPKPLVQFTMQTCAVFAALLILGGRRGLYATVAYVLLGAVGAPVFSGFRGGLGVLLDTTGGYIVGFIAMALVYWLITARLGTSFWVCVAACVAALAVCYAFGTVWFVSVYARTTGPVGVGTALGWCVIPYIVPDLCKLALAAAVAGRAGRLVRR